MATEVMTQKTYVLASISRNAPHIISYMKAVTMETDKGIENLRIISNNMSSLSGNDNRTWIEILN